MSRTPLLIPCGARFGWRPCPRASGPTRRRSTSSSTWRTPRRRFLRESAAVSAAAARGRLRRHGARRRRPPPPARRRPRRRVRRAADCDRRRRHGRAQRRLQAAEGGPHGQRSSRAPIAPAAACSRPPTCSATGLTTELGGEFIDTSHDEMLTLMTEFGLERLDTRGPRHRDAQARDLLHQRPPLHAGAGRARVRADRQADRRGLRLAGRGRELRDRGRRHGVRQAVDREYFDEHRRHRVDARAARRPPTSPSTASSSASSRRSTSSS